MPGTDYHIYRFDTGEIVSAGKTKFLDDVHVPEGCRLATGQARPNADYHSEGSVLERPSISGPSVATIRADGTDEVVFTDLPKGCQVRVDEEEAFIVDDGSLSFTTKWPGIYIVVLSAFPHKDHRCKIIAT